MTDKNTNVGEQHIVQQDALDRLMSAADSQPRLPSNFTYRVMQRILELKVERAKGSAVFLSGLIAIVSLVLGLGMLAIYAEYYGVQDLFENTWKGIQSLTLPVLSGCVLVSLVMLDGFISSQKLKSPQRF